MKTTTKIILAIATVTVMLGAGTASAAHAPSVNDLAMHPGKVDRGPAGVGTADVPPGAPTAAKPPTGSQHGLHRTVSNSAVGGYIRSEGGLPLSGASVSLQYWNGSSWINLASRTANYNGYYAFTMTSGWYYRISAAYVKVACRGGINGSKVTYQGVSGYFYAASGRSYTVSPRMTSTFQFC